MRPQCEPQSPTALDPHRGHPHPTTIPARAVRVGNQTRPKADGTPTHPHEPHATPYTEPPTTSTAPPHPTETAQWTPSEPSPYSA